MTLTEAIKMHSPGDVVKLRHEPWNQYARVEIETFEMNGEIAHGPWCKIVDVMAGVFEGEPMVVLTFKIDNGSDGWELWSPVEESDPGRIDKWLNKEKS